MYDPHRLREAARIRYPYLSSAIFRTQFIQKDSLTFAGISKGGVFYVNAENFGKRSLIDQVEVLVSHLWMVLRAMPKRRSYRSPIRWNYAVQMEINPLVSLPREEFVYPEKEGLAAENYYETLPEEPSMDCMLAEGSGVDGIQEPWEDSEEEKSELHMGLLIDDVAREVIKNSGDAPEGVLQWANDLIHPKVSWESVLTNIVCSLAAPYSRQLRTFSKPSRRDSSLVILPGWKGMIPDIVILLDTSGSMEGESISWALGAISDIVSRFGRVSVIDCDAGIHDKRHVTSEVKSYHGGGGTDMALGMTSIDKYDCMVVLTDGYTDWPETPLQNVVCVVPKGSYAPDWAKKVEIDV